MEGEEETETAKKLMLVGENKTKIPSSSSGYTDNDMPTKESFNDDVSTCSACLVNFLRREYACGGDALALEKK